MGELLLPVPGSEAPLSQELSQGHGCEAQGKVRRDPYPALGVDEARGGRVGAEGRCRVEVGTLVFQATALRLPSAS